MITFSELSGLKNEVGGERSQALRVPLLGHRGALQWPSLRALHWLRVVDAGPGTPDDASVPLVPGTGQGTSATFHLCYLPSLCPDELDAQPQVLLEPH